jgi:hypothetical protein
MVAWLLVIVLIASPLGGARAIDRPDSRILELQQDMRSVRSRVERAPGAASFELEALRRELHDLRIGYPGDPRLQELGIELRRLRAKADRSARSPVTAVLPRRSPLAGPAPTAKPGDLGGAHTGPAAPPARPYFGQRLVALQRNVAAIEARLAAGDTAPAARLLEAAESDLATLRRVFDRAVANDPNLIALEDRIRTLQQRLAPR